MLIPEGKIMTIREKTAYVSTEDGGPLAFLKNRRPIVRKGKKWSEPWRIARKEVP